jgi:uncharacterized membrane protein
VILPLQLSAGMVVAASAFPVLNYDDILSPILRSLIFLANLAGGLVIGVAIIRGVTTYALDLIRARGGEVPREAIRLSLGRSLSLALEFQVAADILGTALNPTREDLIILAAVVALRTLLNFFLGRELDDAQRRERADQPGQGPVPQVAASTPSRRP